VQPGSDGLSEIVRTFGEEVLLPDGTLNRKALAAKVFADAALRDKLNAITHPRIAALGAMRMQTLAASGPPYVIYEAALIVENGMYRTMHALVVVSASVETQLSRLVHRDRLERVDAEARVRAQASLEHKLAVADYVIHNEGDEDALGARVREVHDALLSRFGRSPT
jgi:dephospho-CoA kinase